MGQLSFSKIRFFKSKRKILRKISEKWRRRISRFFYEAPCPVCLRKAESRVRTKRRRNNRARSSTLDYYFLCSSCSITFRLPTFSYYLRKICFKLGTLLLGPIPRFEKEQEEPPLQLELENVRNKILDFDIRPAALFHNFTETTPETPSVLKQ